MRHRAQYQGGFTLLEVMISLAILAMGLTLLLRGTAVNVAATQRAVMMTVATDLARAKMYDLEEELLQQIDEGGTFAEIGDSETGDFDDEGWPQITWESQILKIEMPNLSALGQGTAQGEDDGEGGDDSNALVEELGSRAELLGEGGLAGLAGNIGGVQAEILSRIFEESVRKIRLTVRYKVAGSDEEFTVDCYLTDPASIQRVVSLPPGLDEGEEPPPLRLPGGPP